MSKPKQRLWYVAIVAVSITLALLLMTNEATGRPVEISNSSNSPSTGLYVRGQLIPPKTAQTPVSVHPMRPQSEQIPLSDVQNYAYKRVFEIYGCEQWNYFYDLVMRESGWKSWAQNKTSTAYGLMQFLNSTWAGTGYTKTSDPYQQLEAGFIYIQNRYGTPYKAILFHNINNYY